MPEHDLIRIRRVGDRLRSTFRSLVESFPPSARNISGMARWLDVHKATCQRIVEGLDPSRDGLTALSRFPGTEGMRTHVAAAVGQGVPADRVEAATAAVAEYESLLTTYGHTQRGLVRIIESLRVASAGPEGQPDRELAEDQRKSLFDGARRVTGEEMKGKGVFVLIRPRPEQPARLEALMYTHLVGARRHSFSRPIASFIYSGFWSREGEARPTSIADERPPHELIPEFSSAGLKAVKIDGRDARTLVVVDLEHVTGDGDGYGPADACIRFRSIAVPNPIWDDACRLNVAARIACPARALVMDVFLHHSIASSVVPLVACYSLAAPSGDCETGGPDQCWYERFPDTPELKQMGRGGEQRPRSLLPRQDELIQHAFAREGVNPSEFLGYRVETPYPIWQSEYRMYFEVPRPEAGE